MDVKLKVRRFDPDAGAPGEDFSRYEMDVPEFYSVLDCLIKVREEIDGTLALRCSCRSAICGSCAMRINGQAGLACNTKASEAGRNGGEIVVEPAGNMPVIKDLITDFEQFWNKVRDVDPYLRPESAPPPGQEYEVPNEDMLRLAGVMSCIMCGACVSDCTVLEVDSNFLGPAALAKAYRFVGDPRDDADGARLSKLNGDGGMWDCTRCMQCVEVCPKDVDPMGRIMLLREASMESGMSGGYGARHVTAFTDSVRHSGWLDELRLTVNTFGMFNVPKLLQMAPTALRALRAGKVPPLLHKSIPGVDHVRRLFERHGA